MIRAIAITTALVFAAPRNPHVDAGETAYREGRWDDASTAFAAAYEETGDATFLYTRAQAERRAGRCEVAIDLYAKFLATHPPAEAELAARKYSDECRAALPPPTATVPPPVVTPAAVDDDPPPVVDRPPPRPWHRDPAGGILVGTGAAGLVAGAVTIGLAHREAGRAPDAGDDRDYQDRLDRARRLEIAGGTVLALGSALRTSGMRLVPQPSCSA